MRLEQHLIHLFGNIPCLPKAEIIKHIGIFDLVKILLIDENWKRVIENLLGKDKSSLYILLRSRENATEIEIRKEMEPYWFKAQKLTIRMAVKRDSNRIPLVAQFSELALTRNEPNKFLRRNRLIELYSESFDDFERDILAVVNKLRKLVDLKWHTVNLNFDFGVSFDFLKSLELTKVPHLILKGGSCQVDSDELEETIKKIDCCQELILRVNTTRPFKGVHQFLICNVEFPDSKWITAGMLLRDDINITTGKFKSCQLTGKDFNKIFKKWQRGDRERMAEMYFECDEKIIWFDVIRGLKTEEWDIAVRPSKKILRKVADNPLKFVDLADGLDFTNCWGEVATLHLSKDQKVLQFHLWHYTDIDMLDNYARSLAIDIQRSEEMLNKKGLSQQDRHYYEDLKEEATAKLKHYREERERSCNFNFQYHS